MAQLSKIDHKSKMENFISALQFKKSNYVIRLFSNHANTFPETSVADRPRQLKFRSPVLAGSTTATAATSSSGIAASAAASADATDDETSASTGNAAAASAASAVTAATSAVGVISSDAAGGTAVKSSGID